MSWFRQVPGLKTCGIHPSYPARSPCLQPPVVRRITGSIEKKVLTPSEFHVDCFSRCPWRQTGNPTRFVPWVVSFPWWRRRRDRELLAEKPRHRTPKTSIHPVSVKFQNEISCWPKLPSTKSCSLPAATSREPRTIQGLSPLSLHRLFFRKPPLPKGELAVRTRILHDKILGDIHDGHCVFFRAQYEKTRQMPGFSCGWFAEISVC